MAKSSLALGTFDGLHIGHASVLSAALSYENPVAVVFSVPPAMEISGETEMLMTSEQKTERLEELGFTVKNLSFSKMRNMAAEDFLVWLRDNFDPAHITCGFDYRFGKDAAGNTELLRKFAEQNKIDFNCIPAVLSGDVKVSSSVIRGFIKNGNITAANGLLTGQFSVRGKVLHGQKRGRTIGFPTVNIDYPKDVVIIKNGVYAAEVAATGQKYRAMSYFGNRPTFKKDHQICESYLFNFDGDLYGKEITVTPIAFLREETVFGSLEELQSQIEKDIIVAKKVLG